MFADNNQNNNNTSYCMNSVQPWMPAVLLLGRKDSSTWNIQLCFVLHRIRQHKEKKSVSQVSESLMQHSTLLKLHDAWTNRIKQPLFWSPTQLQIGLLDFCCLTSSSFCQQNTKTKSCYLVPLPSARGLSMVSMNWAITGLHLQSFTECCRF